MFKRISAAVLAAASVALLVTPPAQADAPARYVAMGSSFAAGPGIPPQRPGTPAACGRSTKNYASLVAGQRGLALTDVTCSGATTANILTAGQAGQPPQIEAVTRDTRLVTITIGGNDVGYVGSLFTYGCQNTGGANCGQVDRNAVRTALTTVHEKIGAVVAAVHRRAPRARVLVVDYLTIVPGDRPACDGVPLRDCADHALKPRRMIVGRAPSEVLARPSREGNCPRSIIWPRGRYAGSCPAAHRPSG
ncbi:SGNH/GDSL hydrolase family protein [Amycolatopsis japonica]|uniref:SGNH/GDSL hydrolase family protein n=1 Tax=Amycolatopsis japonica TaxID=208439 RepID=UPI0037B1226F